MISKLIYTGSSFIVYGTGDRRPLIVITFDGGSGKAGSVSDSFARFLNAAARKLLNNTHLTLNKKEIGVDNTNQLQSIQQGPRLHYVNVVVERVSFPII